MKLRIRPEFKKVLLPLAFMMSASSVATAATWEVKVTNLTHGNHFTPLVVTATAHDAHIFSLGSTASTALTAMAECGDLSGLLDSAEVGAEDADTIVNPVGPVSDSNPGFLAPGGSTTAMLTTAETHLSIVAMILPSNDGFIGLDSIHIPVEAGTYHYYVNGYDAGTEANTELKDTAGSCAPGQAGYPGAPSGSEGTGGTGVSSDDVNAMVHVHRGVLGDSDPTGGLSDLDNTVHRWQNPMAKVTVTVQ